MTFVSNNDSWAEWALYRQKERDEITSSVADIKKNVDRCNEIIASHKPKPAQAGNAWQSKSTLRVKASAAIKLTPAQERDAALVLQRKQEGEQREENRKASAQGRKPNILYPELGGLHWVQDHGKRSALEAGMAQNVARASAAAAEEANKTPLAVAQKELVYLENSLKRFTDRLSKVDVDIAHFQQRASEDAASIAWRQSGMRGCDAPPHITAAQKRWDAEMDAKLDTSLPLRGNPLFGKSAWSWRVGHEPDAPVAVKPFSWEDIYETSDDEEENDAVITEEDVDDYEYCHERMRQY